MKIKAILFLYLYILIYYLYYTDTFRYMCVLNLRNKGYFTFLYI